MKVLESTIEGEAVSENWINTRELIVKEVAPKFN